MRFRGRRSSRCRNASPSIPAASLRISCPERTRSHPPPFVKQRFAASSISRFGVCVHGAGEYPDKLRDAAHPIELLYYQGWWDLVASRSVAVVGTREPSRDGLTRTRRLVRELVNEGFTVVSGLAAGIDREAHETAIERNGRTIAVIGTPLSHVYPKAHTALQRLIAERFLLISPVPVKRYESQDYRRNRLFFPERNVVMSALTEATIIVRSGTNLRHADPGARGTSARPETVRSRQLLPQSAPDVAGAPRGEGRHTGRGVR